MVANWNRACRESRGEFVKLLFHDDLIAPDSVENLVPLMDDPEVVYAYSPRRVFHTEPQLDASGEDTYRAVHQSIQDAWQPPSEIWSGRLLLGWSKLLTGALNKIGEPTVALYRKSCFQTLGAFDPSMGQFADVELFYRWACYGKLGYYPRPLARFRVHSKQMTSQLKSHGNLYLDRFYRRLSGFPIAHSTRIRLQSRFMVQALGRKYPRARALKRRLSRRPYLPR